MKKKYLSNSFNQTRKIGRQLAEEALKAKKAFVVGLTGELGGGKTTFLQGFARGLGVKEKILSPTFVIIKRFRLDTKQFGNLYHIDCYRIQKPEELLDLGFKKIISNPQNIVVVEWANRIRKIMPKKAIWINFKFVDGKTRKITLE